MQVQASLSALHRAIDRAASLHHLRRAGHAGAATARGGAGGADPDDSESDADGAQEPGRGPEARAAPRPAPAVVDLVFKPDSDGPGPPLFPGPAIGASRQIHPISGV